MTIMENLKKLLGDDLYKQVMEKLGDKKEKLIFDEEGSYIRKDSGDYVPRARINELNEKHQKEIDAREEQLKKLQAAVKDNEGASRLVEEMQKANTDLKGQNEKLAKENELIKKQAAVKDVLRKNKCKFPDLLVPKFSYDNVKEFNGKWMGIDDQVGILKEEYPDAFGEVKTIGDEDQSNNGHDSPINKKYSELSLTEKAKLKKENPQKFEELKRKG
jgi:DNA-binding transcriptional regulator GbsR (MarR family)